MNSRHNPEETNRLLDKLKVVSLKSEIFKQFMGLTNDAPIMTTTFKSCDSSRGALVRIINGGVMQNWNKSAGSVKLPKAITGEEVIPVALVTEITPNEDGSFLVELSPVNIYDGRIRNAMKNPEPLYNAAWQRVNRHRISKLVKKADSTSESLRAYIHRLEEKLSSMGVDPKSLL